MKYKDFSAFKKKKKSNHFGIFPYELTMNNCVFDFEIASVCFRSFKIRQIDRVRNFTYDSFLILRC